MTDQQAYALIKKEVWGDFPPPNADPLPDRLKPAVRRWKKERKERR